MKCTRIGGKRCNCSCFEIDQEMDAILLIIGIVYRVFRIVIKSVQQCFYSSTHNLCIKRYKKMWQNKTLKYMYVHKNNDIILNIYYRHQKLLQNFMTAYCISPLMLWVQISIRAKCTTLCDKVCHWLVTGQWFSPGPPVSSTNNFHFRSIRSYIFSVIICF
jgi:hypothetical protein